MKYLTALAVMTAFSATASAALIVDFNQFSASANKGLAPSLMSGNRSIDTINYIVSATNYTGQLFYGGAITNDPINAPLSTWQIANNLTIGSITSDWIQLANSATTASVSTKIHQALVFWKQADFKEYSTRPGGVILNSDTNLSFLAHRTAGSPSLMGIVIQTSQPGNPFFVTTMDYVANPTTMSINPAAAIWKDFNVSSSALSVGSTAIPDLTKVIGLGVYFQNDRANSSTGALNFNITNIEFNAIPEPSTYAALFGLLALGMVVWRRRR